MSVSLWCYNEISRRATLAARTAALALFGLTSLAATVWSEPSVHRTGVTRYDPQKAYDSYVMFAGPDHITHLIDMAGNEVHRWPYPGFPSVPLDPTQAGDAKGHVLLQLEDGVAPGTGAVPGAAIFNNKAIGEVDWSGKVVWRWGDAAPGGEARQHHDLRRLPNGDTLVLVNILHNIPGFTLPKMLDAAMYEVTPKGDIVWTWLASDHLQEFGFTPDELKLVRASRSADYLHFNDMAPLGANRFAATDSRFAPDNIVADSRNANFIIIIDRKTGKVVWRIGPDFPPQDPLGDGASVKLPRPVDHISGQHDAHLIEDGLPGAGNLLVFDNEGPAGYPAASVRVDGGSRVLEIDPLTKQIVWQYSGEDSGEAGWTFSSTFISSARRLPNGNTLIDEGVNGRIFQVTPKGEIVWEYVSPIRAKGAIGGGGRQVVSNWLYRAAPVPYDWAPAGTPHAEPASMIPDEN
jgi:hypothetical protein